jgi:hypothetical protein
MTKHTEKNALLKDIQSEHYRLDQLIADLSSEDMLRGGVVGDWSVKDILAHLTAWEQLFLNWYWCGLSGKSPEFAPAGIPTRLLNQRFYEQFAGRQLEDVLADYLASYQEIIAVVREASQEELFSPGRYAWTGKYRLADYLAPNTANHYRWARQKILHWRKASTGSA